MKNLLYILLTTSLCFACGTSNTLVDMGGGIKLPGWAVKTPKLCAVGIQKMRADLGAAKTMAETRARTSLSRQLESKIVDMIKLYNQEGGDTTGDISESLSTNVSKSLSKQTLNGSIPEKMEILEGQVYSLVCLKPNYFTKTISEMKLLSEAQRKQLAHRAQSADDELKEAMKLYNQ
jgi:hypothetical protein